MIKRKGKDTWGFGLRALRLSRNMKAIDLALALRISPSWLSEIEHGRKQVTVRLLEKYARVFRRKPSTILAFCEFTEEIKGGGEPNDE